MRGLRHDDHFVDGRNSATKHFFARRRKYPRKVDLMFSCMQIPAEHPKKEMKEQIRTELQMSQTENFQDYKAFQEKRRELRPATPPRRFTLDERRAGAPNPRITE